MYVMGYSIDSYLRQCCEMDLIDVINQTQKELTILSGMRTPREPYLKDEFIAYRDFLSDFLGFLGGAPVAIIPVFQRDRIKTVIQHFVDKGQLSASILDTLE